MRDRAWYRGKAVYVIGLGSYGTGRETATALHHLGARVTVADQRGAADLAAEREALRALPLAWDLGTTMYAGARTADLVVLSPGVSPMLEPLQRAAQHGVPVVSELQVAYDISRAPMLAVTGTKGKSTTTHLLAAMLSAAGRSVRVGGNIGSPVIAHALEASNEDLLVVEVSSFQLECIDSFRPRVGVFLNFHSDHLDRYSDEEAYWHAKCRLSAFQTPYDWTVLPRDDARLAAFAETLPTRVAWFSRDREVEIGAWVAGDVLGVRAPGGEADDVALADFGLPGPHNRANAAAAAAAATVWECPAEAIARALAEVHPLPGRLEALGTVGGICFVNDTQATTPAATRAALESFDARVVLLAGGRAKTTDFGPVFAGMKERISYLVLYGEAAGLVDLRAREQGIRRVERCTTLDDAFATAYRLAETGDVVLLSPGCASFDQFAHARERGDAFRRLVENLRAELQRPADLPGRAERVG